MKIDLILAWPKSVDYPLWRQFLRDNRQRFNKVIIVFTETNQSPNLQDWLQKTMLQDDVVFLENPPYDPKRIDWRNLAITDALKYSDGDWVWFTEQDFIIKDQKFWSEIEGAGKNTGVIYVNDDGRMHPCSLFLSKEILGKLNKDFSAKPPEYDHFGKIQRQLKYNEIGYKISSHLYVHLNGLTHNWSLVQQGQQPNYRPEQFRMWVMECMKVKVPLNKLWLLTAKKYLGLSWD